MFLTISSADNDENLVKTRTTKTPAFWGYPPPPHDYPYHWVILDPKSKEDKSQSHKFKKIAKISNFWILKWALHATHLLKLLDKMCKYEMDPMSILEDTERTRFCPQTDRRTDGRTDRRTDGQTDRWTRWYQYTPPINFVEAGGIMTTFPFQCSKKAEDQTPCNVDSKPLRMQKTLILIS